MQFNFINLIPNKFESNLSVVSLVCLNDVVFTQTLFLL